MERKDFGLELKEVFNPEEKICPQCKKVHYQSGSTDNNKDVYCDTCVSQIIVGMGAYDA